jgi:hypothetical protein
MSLAHKLRALPVSKGRIPDARSLCEHLQIAMELELSTLPPYMCALYSIQDGTNIEAAGLIRSVLMEEMLHLTLAANILNAIGGRPVLARKGVAPAYPATLPDSDKSFTISLLPFSREAIAGFMRIELPAAPHAPPQADGYHTIGQFYEAIAGALKRLARQGAVRFDHHPERQVSPDDYYNGHGKVIVVDSLEAALKAINEIRDQGEGMHHSVMEENAPLDAMGYDLAHYFRFMEIAEGRRFQTGDTPRSGPTGKLLPVDWSSVKDMVPNPQSGWYAPGTPLRREMDGCNQAWLDLLRALEEGLGGKKQRLTQAVPLMLELKRRIIALMNIPSGVAGTMLGPSFELPEA